MSRSAFTTTLSRVLRAPAARCHARLDICRLSPSSRLSRAASQPQPVTTRSLFSTSAARHKGIMPDTADPSRATSQPLASATSSPVELSDREYHRVADDYLEDILLKLENIQDQTEGVDIEYSAGVMTLSVVDKGTYVVNKQPPNKQVWLSSPISGPKRYDWCVAGDGQSDKEGMAAGNWVYTRDGSTLNSLFRAELGIDLDAPLEE